MKENEKEAAKSSKEGKLKCSKCLEEFENLLDLEKHEESYHRECRYMCPVCNKCYRVTLSYYTHMKTHGTEAKLKCYYCDFETMYTLAFHMHHKAHLDKFNDGPTFCDVCELKVENQQELKKHKKDAHNIVKFRKSTFQGVSKYQCKLCQKEFNHRGGIQKHILIYHMGEKHPTKLCPTCGKIVGQNKFKDHMRAHEGVKPYACTHCKKTFVSNAYLIEHIRIHTGEKPFKCQHCDRCFTQRGSLKLHVRSHTGETPYKCRFCSSSFKSKTALDSHLKAGC